MTRETEFIERAVAGDRIATERLLRGYQNSVFGFLYRMLGDRATAEDAAQETFVSVIRALPRYREEGRFKAWLFQIAHREGIRHAASRRRHEETQWHDDLVNPAPGPLEQAYGDERTRLVEEAIQVLPSAEREVVLLRLREGLPFREIARITGCPLNTTLGRMHNATRRLKERLSALEVSHED